MSTTLFLVVRDGFADVVTKIQPGHEVLKKIKVKGRKVTMSIWDSSLGDHLKWRADAHPEIDLGSIRIA